MGKETPITFTEPAYVLFDEDRNACLTTEWGGLAIFSTQGIAQAFANNSVRKIRVRKVKITPIDEN